MFPPTIAQKETWTQEEAYQYCQRLTRTHYENFTVGSLLLPKDKRRHVYAIYGYCRWVDDLGDEATLDDVPHGWSEKGSHLENMSKPSPVRGEPFGGVYPEPCRRAQDRLVEPRGTERSVLRQAQDERRSESGDLGDEAAHRMALLDWWQKELEACYSGTPTHPVMVALQDTIRCFDIPINPFLKLIKANRMDQRVRRYNSYQDLLYYCDHSANPVGHLFLYLFGYGDEECQRLSDATCTALQLTNFWQDVNRDYVKGRVYLPQEDLDRFGYTEAELAQGIFTDAFRDLLAFEVDRTRKLFARGARLVDLLEGPAKLDVALFTRGGVAVLDAIQSQNYNVLTARPSLRRARKASLFLSTWLTWKLGLGMGLPKSHSGGQ